MEMQLTLSVVHNLRSALQSPELLAFLSYMGYKSEVSKLVTTMTVVQDALLGAKSVQFTAVTQSWYDDLKNVIYVADDLIDRLVTLAESTHKKNMDAGKLVKRMRLLWYRLKGNLTVSHAKPEMIKVVTHLFTYANVGIKLGFTLNSQPVVRRHRVMTCSSVNSEDVIGRDGDKDKIVGMLLDPANANVTEGGVSFLSIVGIGGSGKTTLAQLIFNDVRIQNEFPRRLWACVGNDGPHHLNIKSVLTKILQSPEYDEPATEELARRIRQLLFGNKYLLILDDVCCEDRKDLLQLQHLLKGGSSGSWVLVTTRSQLTAKVIGDVPFYELEDLSDDDSWRLFERIAYGREKSTSVRVAFGKQIIKYCANNPLAIRLIANLLYSQDNRIWSSLAKNGLRNIHLYAHNISQILKQSYDRLPSTLKSCFAYCALFPKNYRINKEIIINLWRAQGFVVPLSESQSIEDIGEEYIWILLLRCFLKDVKRDKYGEIISFKLHPLMHDLARAVTNNEVCAIDCITNDWREEMLHVSVATHTDIEESLTNTRVRTLLFLSGETYGLSVSTLLEKWVSLRALDLNNSGITELPHQIKKLVHLRYLDLSGNMMKMLPKSFTKLNNLETLILLNCKRLRKLPSDLATLVKLKWLDLKGCDSMTSMPVGIGELTCLHKLTSFAVDLSNPGSGDVLEGLQCLTMIRGHLEIRMKGTEFADYERRTYHDRARYLMNKQNLNAIELYFLRDGRKKGYQEVLMEDMRPHSNLRRLRLREYKGEALPGWATGESLATSLPNLVEIKLDQCTRMKHLPIFGKLPYLRLLSLCDLSSVEYMEENRSKRDTRAKASEIVELEEPSSFPSLKELWLVRLFKLKGWLVPLFRDDHDAEDRSSSTSRWQLQESLSFPSLCGLVIRGCPELRVRIGMKEYGKGSSTFYPPQNSSDLIGNSKLLKVTIDSVKNLNFVLWTRSLPCLTELEIENDDNVEKLEEVGEVLKMSSCLSSLRILKINSCIKLRCIGNGALQHLTALEELTISNCYNLILSYGQGAEVEKDIAVDDPSSSPLPQTLRSLKLHRLPKVVNLPQWMQHLTSLQSFHIAYCTGLKSLPEWMTHLTSLTNLEICNCSEDLCNDLESKYVSQSTRCTKKIATLANRKKCTILLLPPIYSMFLKHLTILSILLLLFGYI